MIKVKQKLYFYYIHQPFYKCRQISPLSSKVINTNEIIVFFLLKDNRIPLNLLQPYSLKCILHKKFLYQKSPFPYGKRLFMYTLSNFSTNYQTQ